MFKNLWREKDQQICVSTLGKTEFDFDLGSRIYTSRLIGSVPDLVMHGGGNTSCKTYEKNIFNENIEVICVKGSGWDLETIEAKGLPAIKLSPLLELRKLKKLSDENMVNLQRANLLDSQSPNPSVETLLHAFLPHKFVDHTHATPFLVLANLPNYKEIVEEIFGAKLAVVPYIMPGFELAKKAADIYDLQTNCEGLLLLNHGHFTWGKTAKESYQRVISQTNKVQKWLIKNLDTKKHFLKNCQKIIKIYLFFLLLEVIFKNIVKIIILFQLLIFEMI